GGITMQKEALEYLVSLGEVDEHEIAGRAYSSKPLHLIEEPTPDSLIVRNLTGLVDYVRSNYDNQPPVLIHVESPTSVRVYSTFNADMRRNHLLQAKALLPDIPFRMYQDAEEFNILLQSCFV